MTPIVFLLGPSDIEGQGCLNTIRHGDGTTETNAEWGGLSPLLHFVTADPTMKEVSAFFLVGIHKKFKAPKSARYNVCNLVCDADASATSLRRIRGLEKKLKPVRWINRVDDVLKTARHRLPTTLENIRGCQVPRVWSINPNSFDELKTACEELDVWPLIIRARGLHGGKNMVLVTDTSQIEKIKAESWLYSGIVLIEFIDYRNEDGLYQKTRIVMVDGVAYPHHSIMSDHWAIHGKSRLNLMAENESLRHREERFLAYLEEEGLRENESIFKAIQKRVGLDIFGMDCAFLDDKIVVFEANACMNFLIWDYANRHEYRYLRRRVNALQQAVRNTLGRD